MQASCRKVIAASGVSPTAIKSISSIAKPEHPKAPITKETAMAETAMTANDVEDDDIFFEGAEYTPYSKTCNVVLVLEPSDPEMDKHDYEKACRVAGQKAAAYLARCCAEAGVKAEKVDVHEFANFRDGMAAHPGLPKVGYIYMLQTQGLLHDTYLYGVDVKKILPTVISPLEVMDGAITSGNCVSACDKNSTYVHQNNPVIADMLRRHGKDFNFVACIVTNENVTLADKRRSSTYATKLASMFGLDGVVITEEGFGNPDADEGSSFFIAICLVEAKSMIYKSL